MIGHMPWISWRVMTSLVFSGDDTSSVTSSTDDFSRLLKWPASLVTSKWGDLVSLRVKLLAPHPIVNKLYVTYTLPRTGIFTHHHVFQLFQIVNPGSRNTTHQAGHTTHNTNNTLAYFKYIHIHIYMNNTHRYQGLSVCVCVCVCVSSGAMPAHSGDQT